MREDACPKRDAFVHLVGSWAFASSRNHNQRGSQKWPAEQVLFLEGQGKSLLVWHHLGWMTEGNWQTTPTDNTPASAPSGSVDSRCSPWLEIREETCCVSHDQTLFAIGTWWARQIEGIQVKVEAWRHLPSQLFWRMTQIL